MLRGKNLGKKLLGMSSSWDGFISNCRMRLDMVDIFNASWDSITKIHPLIEHDDGTVQCGKCATGYQETHEAEECCETCWKCGLRGHNMPDKAEDCCPCSCGGEHGFCETSDASDEIEQAMAESLVADAAARAKMKAMYGKPPKGMEDYFRRSWDSIIKEPNWKVNVPYEELSPQQRAATDLSNRILQDGLENVMRDDADKAGYDASAGQCCRSLKETINAIPIDTWGMELLHRELEDVYSDKDCEEFASRVEVQLEIWDLDWESREEYDRIASTWKHNPPHDPLPRDVDISGHEYDSDKEQLRKDQVRQALMEYNACKQQAMGTDFSEADKDHDMFVASSDPAEVAWDSITKIEVIEVNSYEELLIKADIPPFPIGMGGDITPEQMEWMRTYGQRLDPAMPQRQFAHRGGPFIDKRTKAVYQNPANPNKVFKLNAGATLPIAFSHALAAMGYPVAPMTPMGEVGFGDDEGKIRAIMQDKVDVVPDVSSGPRKRWPDDEYFDDYTWQDMFRDNVAGHKFAGQNVPDDLAAAWNNAELDTARGREFLQRQGVNVHEWARNFAQQNREEPDKFKPTYGPDTPQGRLANALNQELRRYKQLSMEAGRDRYDENKRMSNIGGGEWDDPLLRFLQLDASSRLGPNIGLDETGRPLLTSFYLRGSPTMRVGTGGYDGPYGPMLRPRKEGDTYDARDKAAAKMFGQDLPTRSVGFEMDPVYGMPKYVSERVFRPQAGGNVPLDAETGKPLPYSTRLRRPYSRQPFDEIMRENPQYEELFGITPEGINLQDNIDFSHYVKGFAPMFDEEGKFARFKRHPGELQSKYEMTDEDMATYNRNRQPYLDMKMAYDHPSMRDEQWTFQTKAEREAAGKDLYHQSYEEAVDTWNRITGNPTEEDIAAAKERFDSISGKEWSGGFRDRPDRLFELKDRMRDNPLMRYLALNPGKRAILPVSSVRTFNTPGNDDEAIGLFPNPMPFIVDPNNKYPIGMAYGNNGKLPFADARGPRTLPTNFRVRGSNYAADEGMQPEDGKRVMDLGTGEEDYVSNYGEGGQSDDSGIKYRSGPRWFNPQDDNPNTDFIQTIGALHDSYPLPKSTRLAELLANMPDRSLFENSPKQQAIYDNFMKVFPRDVEFWQGMSDNPAMSNDEAFALFNRLRDYS